MDTKNNSISLGNIRSLKGPLSLKKEKRNPLISELVLKGFSQKSIGRQFNISGTRVQEILRVHFPDVYLKIRDTSKSRYDKKREKTKRNIKMFNLYKQGNSIYSIAKLFNLALGRTYQIIKREVFRRTNES